MARGAKEMRQRLRRAALELYRDQGFDRTTAAQIATRAGVTGRTFFRHFADKREVVFEEEALRATLIAGLVGAPGTLRPLAALLWAFRSAEPLLEENRPSADLRREVITATPALQERALAKTAALTNDLAAALRQRGIEDQLAGLAAQVGMAACSHAVAAWDADPSQPFVAHLDRAFGDLQILTG
ncbi:MAG: TetR family transcriptional regulator [Janthinobacterium lividum]